MYAMGVQIAFAEAFGCAICYGIGSILQQIGSRQAKPASSLSPRNLVRFAHHWPYVVGLGVDFLGWILSLLALRMLPLFLVQAAITSAIAVNAVVARIILRNSLSVNARWAIAVVIVGLVLLAFSASPQTAHPLTNQLKLGIIIAPFGLLTAGILTMRFLQPNRIPLMLAALSGIVFSGVGIIGRSIVIPHDYWQIIFEPMAWVLVFYGILGELMFSVALQKGQVTTVFATLFAIETVIPTGVGIIFLGDSARAGWWPAMILGMILIISATITLALKSRWTKSLGGSLKARV